MMLRDKVVVVYGAGGGIGGAVAQAFAREGARLFLTGRDPAPVEVVAKEIGSAGGSAEPAQVDALDERAVDTHLQHVMDNAGRVDISFNAVGIPNATIVGVPLVELDAEQFSMAISTYVTSYFLTARLAAKHMVPNGSGGDHDRHGSPLADRHPLGGRLRSGPGGQGGAHARSVRQLSTWASAWSVCDRRACRRHARSETANEPRAKASGMTWEQWQASLASRTHPRRLMTLEEMAQRGRLHGLRSGERDDGGHRQPDHGEPGRLAASRTSPQPLG